MISGVNHLTQIELFGEAKLEWFRKFLPYEHGIPSHDTIGRVLGQLDSDAFEILFLQWMRSAAANIEGVVAVDGKTLRRAIRRGDERSFVHMVSAFCAANGLVYGQIKAGEKSNEITAIPELLDLLALNGAIITIDAMGCQEAITEKIVDRGGDFIIAVKENQPILYEDLRDAFDSAENASLLEQPSCHETEEVGHGRGEWRKCEVLKSSGKITHIEKWRHVNSIIRLTTQRRLERDSSPTEHVRYFISSIEDLEPDKALAATRAHWAIENNLHWQLDVSFREDECRVFAGNAAENLVVVRHVVLNLLKSVEGMRGGIESRRGQAGWSDSAREKILSARLN
jgi:predicted transposase YbfD/YdcC